MRDLPLLPAKQRATRRLVLGALTVVPLASRAQDGQSTGGLRASTPVLTLQASDGHPVLQPGSRWKATYLDFWASWCTPCRLSFPWMNDMHDRYGAAGLRIVAINLDRKAADAQRFLQQMSPRFAVAMDPDADTARAFDIQAMPSSFLVDAELRLHFSHRGFRPDDRAALQARLAAALR